MNRIKWIDMAKGYGIVLVILGHLYFLNVSGWVYSFHVPLFFFLSGYLFKPNISFKSFLINKANGLLKPYVFLAILIYLYDVMLKIFTGKGDLIDSLIKFIIQRRYTTLWFLTCLLLINILLFFILKINNKVVSVIIVSIITIAGLLYEHFVGYALIWNLDIAFTSVIFAYIGYIVKKQKVFNTLLEKKISAKILLILLFGFINVIGALINNKITGQGLNMTSGQYGFWPLTYIVAFAGIMTVILFSMLFCNKAICYIGENSILYFGLHQAIVISFLNIIYKRLNIFQDMRTSIVSQGGYVLVTMSIVLIILTIFNKLLLKTKFRVLLNK